MHIFSLAARPRHSDFAASYPLHLALRCSAGGRGNWEIDADNFTAGWAR